MSVVNSLVNVQLAKFRKDALGRIGKWLGSQTIVGDATAGLVQCSFQLPFKRKYAYSMVGSSGELLATPVVAAMRVQHTTGEAVRTSGLACVVNRIIPLYGCPGSVRVYPLASNTLLDDNMIWIPDESDGFIYIQAENLNAVAFFCEVWGYLYDYTEHNQELVE
jgi:hypothetical protein